MKANLSARSAEAERREKEKAERLIEYLNSDEQRGVYVSDRDSAAGNAAAGIPTVGNAAAGIPADAGTEKAPKAEAEKVQGEMRTGSPRRARKSPNRPSKSPKKTNPKRRRNGNRNKTWISPPNISPKRQNRFGVTLLTRSQTVSMTRKKQRIKTTKKCPEQTKKQNKTGCKS